MKTNKHMVFCLTKFINKMTKIYRGVYLVLILALLLTSCVRERTISEVVVIEKEDCNLTKPSITIPTRLGDINITYMNDGVYIDNVDVVGTGDGDSMRPVIYSGNYHLLREYKGEELFIGDIIVFDYGSETILHKIITIEDGKITTQGIGNGCNDVERIENIENVKFKAVGVLWE